MRKLDQILAGVDVLQIVGDQSVVVTDVVLDSRKAETGSLFIAVKGAVVDGHKFIDGVVEKGAVVIVCEDIPQQCSPNVTYVQVENSHEVTGIVASNFFGNPSAKLKLVGVTGTNGKTTVTTLLYDLFKSLDEKCGLISTVKILVGEKEYKTINTTPDAVTLNRYFAEMVDDGVGYCFMEVSSHGIHQGRTKALSFAGGVFTNLSHDHLDYHKTFAEYRDVKKSFFDGLSKEAFSLTNLDDKNGEIMLQNTVSKKYTYSLKSASDFKAKVLENQFSGLLLTIDGVEAWVKLIGSFNAYNLLAVYGVATLLGKEKIAILTAMSSLKSVSGRFQYFVSDTGVTAIIDYAHTPDALKNVLSTIQDIRMGSEKVITVVGCGGDRDRDKRPKMAKIAAMMSDQAVFTSDNPRSEDPQEIITQMERGVVGELQSKTISVLDREQGIKVACSFANPKDIVLVAGKGHETYQEVKGVRTHFDDMEKTKELLKLMNK